MLYPDDNTFQRVVKGEIFIFAARCSMLFAVGVGLPIAGYLMHRIASSAEAVVLKLDATSERLGLLEQAINIGVTLRVGNLEGKAADHEARIRVLERVPVIPR